MFQTGQMAGELVAFAGNLGELMFEFDDAADGRQSHALAFHDQDLLDVVDVVAAVPALPAGRTLRGNDVMVIDAAQERLLDMQHFGDLPDGEQRRVFVFQW
jgi:hypothetical protein